MPKILVVDDSDFICAVVKQTLSKENTEVCVACTAKEGVEAAQREDPDLILLDVSLPDMDGFTTCTLLKQLKETAEIPIIFITGHDSMKDIVKGFDVGAVDYIHKPFETIELRARVETHLKNKLMADHMRTLNESLTGALEENQRLANEDPLTGLYNRRYGLDFIERYQQENPEKPSVLIMGDIDDFKKVNDSYGHNMGDEVLCRFTEVLKENVKDRGMVCRWGGEEILIFLHDCELNAAVEWGTQVCKKLNALVFQTEEKTFSCSITLGMTVFECKKSIEHSLRIADEKLYRGKRDGKNRCVY